MSGTSIDNNKLMLLVITRANLSCLECVNSGLGS